MDRGKSRGRHDDALRFDEHGLFLLEDDSVIVLWGTQDGKAVLGIFDIAPGGSSNERALVGRFRSHLVAGLDKTFSRGRLDQ